MSKIVDETMLFVASVGLIKELPGMFLTGDEEKHKKLGNELEGCSAAMLKALIDAGHAKGSSSLNDYGLGRAYDVIKGETLSRALFAPPYYAIRAQIAAADEPSDNLYGTYLLVVNHVLDVYQEYTFVDGGERLFTELHNAYPELSGLAAKSKYKIDARTARLEQQAASTKTGNTTSTSSSSSGGCYVATAVYGSYDCPSVWVLRRFRDYRLAKSAAGRAFIRTYYAISPKLVERFEDSKAFKQITRKPLDRLVAACKKRGYSDTAYSDRVW